MPKISIPFDNDAFFLVIIFVIFTVPKVMLFGYFSNCDVSFKISN